MGAPIMSTPVKNMTVAIIGTGRIGLYQLVKFIFGFGAKVVGYDAYPNNSLDFIEYKDTVEEAIASLISFHYMFDEQRKFPLIRCRYVL